MAQVIPPLSQSRYEQMACPEQYALVQIDGVKTPPSNPSNRGTEVHGVLAPYQLYCGKHEVNSDWGEFDRLTEATGSEAADILNGMRDNYTVDWEHLLGVEHWLGLKEDLSANVCMKGSPMAQKTAYEGTLDGLYFTDLDIGSDTATKVYIPDFKSHWRPFDADTFQSKLYPFLVFQHYETIEEVTFELIFTRFKNARRSVTYTRENLPALAAEIERARKRQIAIHDKVGYPLVPVPDGKKNEYWAGDRVPMDAIPGAHCTYCPHLAKGTCPLGEANPYGSMTLEDRLKHVVQIDAARKFHLGIIKDYVDNSLLPVSFEDGSGNKYEAAFRAQESSGYFPLLLTVAMLMEYAEVNPDDKTLFNRLRVGSSQLKPKLKAKKRVDLDQRLRDSVMVKETAVRFGIKGVEEEEEEG